MGKYKRTIDTFNNVAKQYWDKFKDFALYQDTYNWFLEQLPKGPINLLEVACGPGNVSRYLLSRNTHISLLGIDLAPDMLKLAQRHNPQAQFKLMDCREISLLNTTFDAIMCGFCLPYISWQDSQKLIQDMALLLKPDGILYLSLTEGDAEKEGFKGSDSSGGVIYVHYHNIEAVKHCLAQSGLQVLDEKMITHIHNQESTEDIFILAKKPPMIR